MNVENITLNYKVAQYSPQTLEVTCKDGHFAVSTHEPIPSMKIVLICELTQVVELHIGNTLISKKY